MRIVPTTPMRSENHFPIISKRTAENIYRNELQVIHQPDSGRHEHKFSLEEEVSE
jgi:hypothetical protein